MYSPRIRDDLIPGIYRAARATGIPMTTWVNQVVEQALSERAAREEKEESTHSVVTRLCSQRNRKEKENHDTTAI
jgi:hypothetical protein